VKRARKDFNDLSRDDASIQDQIGLYSISDQDLGLLTIPHEFMISG